MQDACGQHWPVSRLILLFYYHNLPWQRCSPCPSAALRGQKGVKVFFVPLRGPSWIKRVKGVLRAPPRPSADKKVLRCSPCPSAALRGQKGVKVFSVPLRGPPWTKRVSGVLRAPPRPSASSADKKVLRCSPCPSVALRGKKGLRCSPRPSAPLRGQKGVKVFSAPLRGPPWIKRV